MSAARGEGPVDGVLLDIDGVIATAWRPLPGVAEALAAIEASGSPRAFLTSTTSRTRADIVAALRAEGVEVDPDEVLTAAVLTAEYLQATYPGARVWVLNSDADLTPDMPGIELDAEDPEVVVLGGAGEAFSQEALSRVVELMLEGTPVVAMHRGLLWATGDGLRVDTGVYLPGLEAAGGAGITAVGKPSLTAFLAAADVLGTDPARTMMVGDDLHSDVLAAQRAGLIGVLVRTGKFRQVHLEMSVDQPDHIIDSIADLPALLARLAG
ncbi:HAD-IIA family hydrolase [Tomitella biformata]|uniref:HAD-IIA family hydrolase n=1 Tax=Tomitella biformata TaxID=630403 RepID=UPI000464EB31|nr:HAD-IIA family hydrolase [Tomitella biformata]